MSQKHSSGIIEGLILMKKKHLFSVLAIIFIFIGFFLLFQIVDRFLPKGKGALKVDSNVRAKVLLNGKVIGNTPLCKCDPQDTINAGLYALQVVPEDGSETYSAKVKIINGVLTAVDRTFLPGSYASSYVLYLEKISGDKTELFVSSVPDGSLITLDGNDIGVTPKTVTNISASEHALELQKGGYGKKTILVRTVPGYKLIVEAVLGTVPTETENLPGQEPPPTPTPTPATETVTILATPVGFLRVRSGPGVNFSEVAQVKPNETFKFLNEQNGWYQIQIDGSRQGWVTQDFANKSTSQ